MIHVIYDSAHGNTKRIAQAIYEGASSVADAEIIKAGAGELQQPVADDIYLIGSPTQGGRPTSVVTDMIKTIPGDFDYVVRFAAFDTRFAHDAHGLFLRLLMRIIGYGADKIDKAMSTAGAKRLAKPEGCIVHDTEGPLADGEIERAKEWGKTLARHAK